MAGRVGLERNIESIASGRKPRFKEQKVGELFTFHIMGAMAECAVAKYLGKYWGGHVNRFETGDVCNYEVRWSMRKDLKIRERDFGRVISVTGALPELHIAGYIFAERGRTLVKPTSPVSGPPAYFVPHQLLSDIDELVWASYSPQISQANG